METIRHNFNAIPTVHPNPRRKPSLPSNGYLAVQLTEKIYVIDEDLPFRKTLSQLLASHDMEVICFDSSADCFANGKPGEAGCLIVDLRLSDDSRTSRHHRICWEMGPPIIFMSGNPDIRAAVRAMKMGAIEVLTKPVDLAVVVEAVREALAQNRKLRLKKAEVEKLQYRYSLLSPRERDVVPLIVGGLLNKQAAAILGISTITLQVHRGQVMRKMEAESVADLVRMALKLRIPYWCRNYRSTAQST
ncbi:response regulator transcription factor [Acidicapsa acidisoli]|uniref:response regulator transcription factor n=1 Tax=Acidicapsa acidisoli TaxID=1615681 RepID=UPI00295BEB17|nr:LuxR C-terminal-related transcriptional regulator [Acidicapsa acidisoli]